jgi:general secretion pathway protein D
MFFEGNVRGPSFKMQSIGDALRRYGGGSDAESFFSKNPGRALALTFKASRTSLEAADMNTEPIAEISTVACRDREEWKRLMWELNHPGADGAPRYTILIHQPEDINGVKLAVALKNTILANGNEVNTVFDNFLPGRVLNLQEASPNWERVIEANVARNFFWDDFYIPAFNEELDRAINDLDRALRAPDVASGLDLSGLPAVK